MGSASDYVVDVEINQVDAQRFVVPQQGGHLHLGAHAIGAGGQDGVLVVAEAVEAGEGADAFQDFRPVSKRGEGSDAFLEGLNALKVNAGGLVGAIGFFPVLWIDHLREASQRVHRVAPAPACPSPTEWEWGSCR